MKTDEVTPQAKTLFDALVNAGVYVELEHYDGHKKVDILIPRIKLFIEVDGVQHYTDPEQIMTDFLRDKYSQDDGYDTLRIPNEAVENNLDGIVKAIIQILSRKETFRQFEFE
jgi:very-short-patch-repair endonuclease